MFEEIEKRMQAAVGHLKDELAQIRTGRATPALVSDIVVDVYDTKMAVKELAQITAPEPTIILISPWDKSIITNISGGIAKSNLGFNPTVDGDIVRVTVPALTSERREQFIRQMHQLLEKYRVEIRQIRHEFMEKVKDEEKNGQVGEDEAKRQEHEIQKLHDSFVEEIEAIGKTKEEQLREV